MRKTTVFVFVILMISSSLAVAEEAEHGPVFDGKFWYNQLIKFVNFAVIAGVIFYFVRKPIIGFFQQRSKKIASDIKAAQSARDQAEQKLREVEVQVSSLESTVQEIKEKAKQEGEQEKTRIVESARVDAERILQNAQREIQNRVKSSKQDLKEYAARVAIERAREILRERLTDEDEHKLVDRTIARIGDS